MSDSDGTVNILARIADEIRDAADGRNAPDEKTLRAWAVTIRAVAENLRAVIEDWRQGIRKR